MPYKDQFVFSIKVTFAPNLAKKISTNFYYLSLFFQLSVAYSENFKEINAWEVLKFLKEKIGILPIYFAWRQKLIVFTFMPSLYFVRKFYNLRTYAALLRHFLSLKCRSCQILPKFMVAPKLPYSKYKIFNDSYFWQSQFFKTCLF